METRRLLYRCFRGLWKGAEMRGIDLLESTGSVQTKAMSCPKLYLTNANCHPGCTFYKTRDKSLAERLSDPNVWDPSQFDGDARSEEHTSELQSLRHLVC